MVSQQIVLENFPMDHQEKFEFSLCKHEMVCFTMEKYNNPPISQWEH
jgi:hypothetical protein